MKQNIKKTTTEKKITFGNRYTAVRKNGETFPAMTFASPIISEDNVVGIRGIILDMSENEAMEKALRESEKRYRELAELLPQTVYEHDMDGKLTYLNEAGKKTFGIESLETGVSANDLVVAEDIERMLSNMQKSSFGNTTSRGNSYTAMRLNGEKFPVMIFATPMISEEKISGIRGIVIDMTEYMAMENALRESEQKYKTLVENSLEGITIIRDNRILFANDTYCKMLGYTREELYNMPSVNTLQPDDREKALKIAERRRNLDYSTIFEDFKPSSVNQPGKEFPQVNSEGRVRVQIKARDAHKVQLDISAVKYDLVKDTSGVWTGESAPQDEGFHYYQLWVDGAAVPDPSSLYFYGASRWGSGIEIPAKDQDFYVLKNVLHGQVIELPYFSKSNNSMRRCFIYTPPG